MINVTRPFRHTQTTFSQGKVIRDKTPVMYMPKARPMREPGTGYLTYVTAKGPLTVKAW